VPPGEIKPFSLCWRKQIRLKVAIASLDERELTRRVVSHRISDQVSVHASNWIAQELD